MSAEPSFEGFKWPVSAEQAIAVPAAEVWSIISRPGNLEPCHPFCLRNPVMHWPGPDAVDEVHYLSGWVYQRRFRDWREGSGYDLDIFRADRRIAHVRWEIQAASQTESRLRITVLPLVAQGIPRPLRWWLHRTRIGPPLRFYLESVVRGFEWFLTRGQAVPREQFGRHPWYSAR